MTTKWTKGPLTVVADYYYRAGGAKTPDGFHVEDSSGNIVASAIENGADARLFASAPELYEALQEAEVYITDSDVLDKVRAALRG